MQIYKLKGFKFFQNFLPRSIEKFGIICYILTDDAFFFASACLFVLWHCCSFALPHTQSPATPLKNTTPTLGKKQTLLLFCNSCHCYSVLSTCIKFNNKSFGVKRKQNQSAWKNHRTIGKGTFFKLPPYLKMENFKVGTREKQQTTNGMWGERRSSSSNCSTSVQN